MRPRSLYFVLFIQLSSQGRFMSLFLADRGLTDSQIGVCFGIQSTLSVVMSPLFGMLADKTGRKHGVLSLCTVGAMVAFLLHALPELGIVPQSAAFPYLAVLTVFRSSFQSPLIPILDAITLDSLGDDKKAEYGKERLWGAISWAGAHLLLGVLLDVKGLGTSAMYILSIASTIAVLVLIACFKKSNQSAAAAAAAAAAAGAGATESTEDQRSLKGPRTLATSGGGSASSTARRVCCGLLCRDVGVATFFVMVVTMGIAMSLVENLLFLFFRDDLQASNLICGVSVVITVLFELPLFALSGRALKKFGVRGLIIIAHIAYVVRAVGYTLFEDAWLVLTVEPMHGVTYACAQIAMVHLIAEMTPPDLRATGQTLLSALRGGLGYTLGTAVGGAVLENYGSKVLFRSGAGLALVGLLCFLVGGAVQSRRRGGGAKVQYRSVAEEEDDSEEEQEGNVGGGDLPGSEKEDAGNDDEEVPL